MSGLRRQAIEAYGRLGLPHRRIEAWKYTDLRARLTDVNPLVKAEGIAVSEADLARALGGEIAGLPAYRLVVVEGDLRADLSDIAGLKARRRRGGLARRRRSRTRRPGSRALSLRSIRARTILSSPSTPL